MSLIIDLIIILAAVAAIYLGIMRGFVKSVMHFASLILAMAAAFFFTQPAADWLGEQVIDDWVSGITRDGLTAIVSAGTEKLELSTIIADRPEALTSIAERFGCDLDELAAYYDGELAGLAEEEAIEELSEMIAAPTASAISTVLAAIGVFVAALIVLWLVTFVLDMICRLPLLDKLNAFLGLLFGIGSALITSWVIANLAVGLITALESINSGLFNSTVISGSVILRFFYEHSLILF